MLSINLTFKSNSKSYDILRPKIVKREKKKLTICTETIDGMWRFTGRK